MTRQYSAAATMLGLSACILGCVGDDSESTTTKRSALTTNTSRLIVPAYWDDASPSWTTIEYGTDALPAGSIVIANYADGPGYTTALYNHLATLRSHGVIILGYVAAGLPRINNAENDIWTWSWTMGGQDSGDYGPAVMDGIFLDESDRRNDDDINRLEWLGSRIHTEPFASSPAYVMYNMGTPYHEQNYVDCLLQVAQNAGNPDRALFMNRETYENTYRTVDDWSALDFSWVRSYRANHFAHIVHDATTSSTDTSDVLQKARDRNAVYVYLTELSEATNPWVELATSTLWHDQISGTNASFNDFNGPSSETYTSSCPAACGPVGSPCWCGHPLCEAGVWLDAACSPCAATICAPDKDPWCCQNGWDSQCVSEVGAWCNSTYSCCAHPLCETGVALDPTCSPCAAIICAPDKDPWCCQNGWDSQCVGEVGAWCDSTYSCAP